VAWCREDWCGLVVQAWSGESLRVMVRHGKAGQAMLGSAWSGQLRQAR